MANLLFAWIKNHLGNKFYPYTHSDAVYVDDTVPKNLTTALDEIDGKINQVSGIQSDWNENDSTKNTYIKNKPSALPANGGNADTLNGLSSADFISSDILNNYVTKTEMDDELSTKVDRENNKGLISNTEKDKLSNIPNIVFSNTIPTSLDENTICFVYETEEAVS